jgi:uncharacterized protein YegP (UPF0339 family)
MKVVAIKDSKSGQYYAGCNKKLSQTLLGAQLYKSAKTAQNVINKSINFHILEPEIVNVVLEEEQKQTEEPNLDRWADHIWKEVDND